MEMNYTPRQIAEKLDQYIIGQQEAKRSVAVALRNRYRRMQLDDTLRDEIMPKNILMIGPTGVGKTEIARRLAKLVNAPFIKVEATKFTEVGYVGRDVESMVRDLVEEAFRIVKNEKMAAVKDRATEAANRKLVRLLVPELKKKQEIKNPLEMLFTNVNPNNEEEEEQSLGDSVRQKREEIKRLLAEGKLEDRIVQIEIEEQPPSMFDLLQGSGMEHMGMNMQEVFGSMFPARRKKRKLPVREARKILIQQEAQKLIDLEEAQQEAVERAEQSGIIFIDEIDKVAGSDHRHGPDVSREGVQRDILPIVEGSTVMTKYGPVKTDHMLFIAAGAFHIAKPSDLIPELQGRFPVRVEFQKLGVDDFYKILTEPSNALLKQYKALLKTEGIELIFTDAAVRRIAEIAYQLNQETENIGARRLHTILEKLLEDLSFEAPDINLSEVEITPQYVDEKLKGIVDDKNLSQFIL